MKVIVEPRKRTKLDTRDLDKSLERARSIPVKKCDICRKDVDVQFNGALRNWGQMIRNCGADGFHSVTFCPNCYDKIMDAACDAADIAERRRSSDNIVILPS